MLTCSAFAQAGELNFDGEIGIELRAFPLSPQQTEQLEHWQPSLILGGEARWESTDGKHQLLFEPFARWDEQDEERTHFDLREAYYRYSSDQNWSLLVGAAKIFWGVAESRHLVDVINQSDAVEDIDEEDKLGQPMVQFSVTENWGDVSFFVLPGFRDRTFPGVVGRLRPPLVIDDDAARYEARAGANHVDFALRYSHYFGDWDVGLSAFHGTSREPRLALAADGATLVPIYDQMTQFGADIQYTSGAWLWKLETIYRDAHADEFIALVAGFEYTAYQIAGRSWDLGLIAEYQYDGRKDALFSALTVAPFETTAPLIISNNDVFTGLRLAFNDTQDTSLLAGATTDADDGSTLFIVEAKRRLGANWTFELEGRFFEFIDDGNALLAFKDDDFITIRLTRRF